MDPARRLARIQALRAAPERDLSLRGELGHLERLAKKAGRALRGIGPVWDRLAPPDPGRDALLWFQGSELRVYHPDSGARHRLSAFLRSGGETAIIRAAPTAVTGVRIAHRPPEGAADPDAPAVPHTPR